MSEPTKTNRSARTRASEPPRPVQFTLRKLLLLVACVCVVLGVGRRWGFLPGYFVGISFLLSWVWWGTSSWRVVVVLALPGLIAGGLFLSVRTTDRDDHRSYCTNNMRQMVLALYNYENDYDSFPPAYTTDADGNRLHSWRTLILPYLEEQRRYDAIDLAQPWDAPANQPWGQTAPGLYRCPANNTASTFAYTSYVAVTGDDTMWPGARGRRTDEVTDGLGRTIMIVEIAGCGIPWMEPRDLTLEEVLAAFRKGDVTGIGCYHEGGANVALASGQVVFLDPDSLDEASLRALFTVDGGEEAEFP